MEVKQVIICALNILGRVDVVKSLSSDNKLGTEEQELVDVLLYCFNAVEDELARKYFPLITKEQLTSEEGTFYYTTFSHTPVKIRRITADGADVKCQLEPLYIVSNAKTITVEYEYAPEKKSISGVCDLGVEVGEDLIASGMVAEYSLINGEIEQSELWEERYRKLIDGAQRTLPRGGRIPPRRWV